ncbi:adrenomedullin 5 isoform X1 [Oryzias latipes]|uniref:adrenomedullin 5 isoform X1 n=1 Tax=Oryzias latipes TaxID=8090 RepID=UPI0005CC2F77|nr:adrenomedullin 5 isoform X1 [Oryzias latipes]
MEIAFLLLLTVSLTTAGPLKLTPKRESEVGVTFFGTPVQTGATGRADKDAPPLKVVPFHSEGKRFGLEPLKQSSALILRLRRALQRGCQLGTCQLHNLANTLYHINKTNGKEESTKAHDPQGYGR